METILTYHPQKRKGIRMKKSYYDTLRIFIIQQLEENYEVSFHSLVQKLPVDRSVGNTPWNLLMVKLDLEARDIIRTKKLLASGKAPVIYLKKSRAKNTKTTL